MKNKNSSIQKKEEIKKNPDHKIDQDFEGYPQGPGKDETIKPKTSEQRRVADTGNKDGEKRIYRKGETDEQDSDGSANAFEDK